MDALSVAGVGFAVNAVVWGVPVHRLQPWHRRRPVDLSADGGAPSTVAATTVVVLVGEHVAGFDISPRGHPGDGVGELQVYGLDPGQRRSMVARLGSGTHLPHPQITHPPDAPGQSAPTLPLQLDGGRPVHCRPPARRVDIELLPGRDPLLI